MYRFNGIDTVGDQPLADLFRCHDNYDGFDALDKYGDVYPSRTCVDLFSHFRETRDMPRKMLLSFGTTDFLNNLPFDTLHLDYSQFFTELMQTEIEEIYFILPLPILANFCPVSWSRYCALRALLVQCTDRYPNIHLIDLADLFVDFDKSLASKDRCISANIFDKITIKYEYFDVDLNGYRMINENFIARYENALKQRVLKLQKLRKKKHEIILLPSNFSQSLDEAYGGSRFLYLFFWKDYRNLGMSNYGSSRHRIYRTNC